MQTKRETKAARRAALRARLERALSDIYGNARTRWPDADVPGFTGFYDWLGGYAERADALRDDIRENRESFALLARELRGLRHVNAPAACGILRERLRGIARDVRDAARELSGVNATLQAVRA